MIGLESIARWITTMCGAITAMGGAFVVVKKFRKEIKLVWDKIVKPTLKFTAISLTLILPNGIIVWYFVFRIAEDWSSIIRNSDVFLSIVAWLTISVSAYSLFWGMWLYPAIIRLFFQNMKSPDEAKLNQTIDDQERGTL